MTPHDIDFLGFIARGDTAAFGWRACYDRVPGGGGSTNTARSGASSGTVQFGAFEFDAPRGELRKHGSRIKLQGQPIQVLAMLLEHPGEVVTRDDLQKRLWPAETYVDFEHSLNAAIKRLRAALGDSAQSPLFVETLARRGYRFIAPLKQPEENVRQVGATDNKTAVGHHFVWISLAVAACVLIAVTGTILVRARNSHPIPNLSGPIRSLAVLPLANLSGDREQDYFVDGMTDALRQHLEAISSLRVISRTSSVHYRGTSKPLRDVARELNVDAVIDGSVLRSGDRVRINVELIHAGADQHLWSNSYEGDVRDVFVLQAGVAQKIADEIRITLTPPDRARLTRVHTPDPDAYMAYSKGRFYWNKRTASDLKKAIGFFQQAVGKDPGYALAYDGLADSWVPLGWYGYMRPTETFPHAKAAVTKALSLDDSLAEAHTTLAFVNLYYDRDWEGAEREFRRGIELNPNYANGHHWYAEFLSLVGRHQEAIAESQRARELDPLSDIINAWVSSRYFFARQYDKAIEEGRNAVEMDPNFAPAHLVLGQAFEQKGLLKEAIAEFERAAGLATGSLYIGSLAHALGTAGKRVSALKAQEDLMALSETSFVSSYDLALAYIGLGNKAKAFELLNRAIQERSPRVAFLAVDPRLDDLRRERRFKELRDLVGLPMTNPANE